MRNRKKTGDLVRLIHAFPFLGWAPLAVIPLIVLVATPKGYFSSVSGSRRVAQVSSSKGGAVSASQPVEGETKLYGNKSAAYLPRWTKVFGRIDPLIGVLELQTARVLAPGESVHCQWFRSNLSLSRALSESADGEFSLDALGRGEFAISNAMGSVYCRFDADDFGIEMKISVRDIAAPEQAESHLLRNRISDDLALVAKYQDVAAAVSALDRDPKSFDNAKRKLDQFPELRSMTNTVQKTLMVYDGMVTGIDVARGDWYRIYGVTGQAKPHKFALKSRGPEGAEKPLVLMKREDIVWPEANFFALVCGFESRTVRRLTHAVYTGSGEVVVPMSDRAGTVRCAYNTVPKKWDHAQGRFDFRMNHVKKPQALEKISVAVTDLNNRIASHRQQIADIQKRASQAAQQLVAGEFKKMNDAVAKIREFEPEVVCKREVKTPSAYRFSLVNRMETRSGEFCSGAATWTGKVLISGCDGEKATYLDGRYIRYDLDMNRLSTDKVKALSLFNEGSESVDRYSKPIARVDVSTGQFVDFVSPTSDGRLIFLNQDGKRTGELTFGAPYLAEPQITGDGRVIGLARGANSTGSQLFAVGLDQKLLWTKPIETGMFESPRFAIGAQTILLTDSSGVLSVFDDQGNLKKTVPYEAGKWSSEILVLNDVAYFGTENGKVFVFDLASEELRMVYQVKFSGETDPQTLKSPQPAAISRAITHRPYVTSSGEIMVVTQYDGRMHFIGMDGVLKKQVQAEMVLRIMEVGEVRWPGEPEPLIFVNTATYMSGYRQDGTLVALFDLGGGGEMYNLPFPIGQYGAKYANQFLVGDYHGVGRYKMEKVATETATTKLLEACTQ